MTAARSWMRPELPNSTNSSASSSPMASREERTSGRRCISSRSRSSRASSVIVGEDQEVELLLRYPLGSPVRDRRKPRRTVGSAHLESRIVVDDHHLIVTPEMGVPAPRLEPGVDPIDIGCAARDPVDVPPVHGALVVAQQLVG